MGIGRNGGIIGVTNTPTPISASGVWTLNEVRDARADLRWPGKTGPITWDANNNFNCVLSNGDLTAQLTSSSGNDPAIAATANAVKTKGKHYMELYFDSRVVNDAFMFGVGSDFSPGFDEYPGSTPDSYALYGIGRIFNNSSWTAYGSDPPDAGQVVGMAVDLDAGKIWWATDNVWQASGNPVAGTNEAFSGLSGTYLPLLGMFGAATIVNTLTARFKSADFTYTPPSGFSSWET